MNSIENVYEYIWKWFNLFKNLIQSAEESKCNSLRYVILTLWSMASHLLSYNVAVCYNHFALDSDLI